MESADMNGHAPPEVAFGPDPSDRITVEWASRALTWLKANRPQVFGEMMQTGVFGIERARGRRS